ncbi:hypothetical protein PR048_014691, partial [Dryococelus australis]
MKCVQGEGYVSSSGKEVCAEKFTLVSECCQKKCYEKVAFEVQKNIYDLFYSEPQRKTVDSKKPRDHTWTYHIVASGCRIHVCLKFILSLCQVSVKHLRIIKKKLLRNESLEEKRGTHKNRLRNISDDAINMMGEHLSTLPHYESHYCKDKSNMYFDNTLLTVKNLYDMFKVYYKEKCDKPLQTKYKTFYRV